MFGYKAAFNVAPLSIREKNKLALYGTACVVIVA